MSITNRGGCYKCRVDIEKGLVLPLSHQLQLAGRTSVVDGGFLIIEFTDGFDALFVQIVADRAKGSLNNESAILEEFERIDSRRRTVLFGLRRHAAKNDVSLRENATGRWDIQNGCATSEIHLGPLLTRSVANFGPDETLMKLVEASWLPRLTPSEAAKLLEPFQTEPTPLPWKNGRDVSPLIGPEFLALDCGVLGRGDDSPADPDALLNAIASTRHALGQQLLNRLVDRLGRWRFSIELLGKGEAQIGFTDEFDSYWLHPRSKKLARLIASEGLETCLDRLASEFLALDQARGRTLNLVRSVVARSGCRMVVEENCWWFGKTHRVAKFELGRTLTLALSKSTPECIVHSWLRNAGLTSEIPSEETLKSWGVGDFGIPQVCWLPSIPPEEWDCLPQPAELDLTYLDLLARDCLDGALREAEVEPGASRIGGTVDLLSLWSKPFWYRPGDLWAGEEFWNKFARKAWQQSKRDLAVVILAKMGEMPADFDLEQRLNDSDCWSSEAYEDEWVWQFVDQLPWPIDEWEYPKFPSSVRPRPSQIIRRAVRAYREAMTLVSSVASESDRWHALESALAEIAKVDRLSVGVWLRSEEMHELERQLRLWAQSSEFGGHDWDAAFEVAAEFGWAWLPTLLAENPLFIPAQFAFQESFSRPGEVALKLSWVSPGTLAARFAAQALKGLTPELMETRARSIAGSADFFPSGRKIVSDWQTVDRFAAAIAWQRCRSANPVGLKK